MALFSLHADVWWGAFMTFVGLFYTIRYNPTRHRTLTRDAHSEIWAIDFAPLGNTGGQGAAFPWLERKPMSRCRRKASIDTVLTRQYYATAWILRRFRGRS